MIADGKTHIMNLQLPAPGPQGPLGPQMPPPFEPIGLKLSEENKLALMEQWRAIRRYGWQILALGFMGMVVAAAIALALTPIYRSTCTLFIEASRAKVASLDDVYGSALQNKEFYQSQIEILKSRAVAIRTARSLKLWDVAEFDPRKPDEGLMARVRGVLGLHTEQPKWTEEALATAAGERLMGLISIEPVRSSQLVKVSVESPDKRLAMMLANALAQSYIESDREAKFKITQQASTWFSSRLTELLQKLTASEAALQNYREQQGLVDLSGSTETLLAQQASDTSNRLADARARRLTLESAYQQVARIGNGDYSKVPVVVSNSTVSTAVSRELDAKQRLATIESTLGTAHSTYKEAVANLEAARLNTQMQRELVAKSILTDYQAARNTEARLEAALGHVRNTAQKSNRQEFQLSVLQREVDSNRQLYTLFMTRAKETDLAADLQDNVARVIDPAATPNVPVRPRKFQITAVAGVLSLMLGGLLAMLIAKLDNTIKTGDEVEERLHLPVLTTLPALKEGDPSVSRLFLDQPQSQHAEAIRTARTGVLLSNIDRDSRVLMVTSCLPGEGKTSLACNLALAHAQTRRTILVDADMRKPQVGPRLGVPPGAKGLSNLIAGTASLSECLHAVEGSALMVVPAGDLPPSTLELLHSQRFSEVMELLRQSADIVLIDTPPVEIVSDALAIAPKTDGTIYVVKAMSTAYPVARKGITRLQRAGGKVLGVVVNSLNFDEASRYYGYRYNDAQGYYGTPAKRLEDASGKTT